jgi:hypothetical protein
MLVVNQRLPHRWIRSADEATRAQLGLCRAQSVWFNLRGRLEVNAASTEQRSGGFRKTDGIEASTAGGFARF